MTKNREKLIEAIEEFIEKSDAPELTDDEQESLLLINTAYKHLKFARAVFPAVEFLVSNAAGVQLGSILVKHLNHAAKEISERVINTNIGQRLDIYNHYKEILTRGALSAGYHAHVVNLETCANCPSKDDCSLLEDFKEMSKAGGKKNEPDYKP